MPDEAEIQRLISLYHEGASTYDWDQIVGTFLPDGVWEVPSMGMRCQGHAELREQMPALVSSIEYLVQINAPAIIDVDGDRATARSLIRECAQFRDGGVRMDVVGRFSDELQRTPDGWRFAHRTFTIIGTHMTEGRG
jgi:hypothetical protein